MITKLRALVLPCASARALLFGLSFASLATAGAASPALAGEAAAMATAEAVSDATQPVPPTLDAARVAWIAEVLGEAPQALRPAQRGFNSSASWVVTYSRGRAFYKQLAFGADGELSPSAERAIRNNQEAHALGFGPEVLGVDAVHGVMLLAFVEGEVGSYDSASIAQFRGPALRTLRQLHAATMSGRQAGGDVAQDQANCATLQLQAVGAADANGYDIDRAATACHAYSRRLATLTPVFARLHNDLNPHNMVLHGDVVHLIDWDTLGEGDYVQDLALYAMEHDVGVAEMPALLRDYQGDEAGLLRAQLMLARLHARRYLTHVVGMPWDLPALRAERLRSYAHLVAQDAALLGSVD